MIKAGSMEASSNYKGKGTGKANSATCQTWGLDMYRLRDVEKWNGKLEQASDSQVLSTK
jgi:hypothetical protein